MVSGTVAADAALVAVDGSSGVQGGTEIAWAHADAAGPLPRVVVVTRLDRENADFDEVMTGLREAFGSRVVPLALPVGQASGLSGQYDLRSTDDPPAAVAGDVDAAREMLIEAVVETDDELLEQYLEGEELSRDTITGALHDGIASGELIPVVPICATAGIGVEQLLTDLVELMPSPLGRQHALAEVSVETAPTAISSSRSSRRSPTPSSATSPS